MSPDVHGGDAAEPERVQGVGDRLALRVEKPTARYDLHCDAIAAHSLLSVSGVDAGGAAAGLTSVSGGGDGGALCTRGCVVRSSSTSERDAIGRLSEPTLVARFVGPGVVEVTGFARLRAVGRAVRLARVRRVPIPLSATPTTLPLARRTDVARRPLRALSRRHEFLFRAHDAEHGRRWSGLGHGATERDGADTALRRLYGRCRCRAALALAALVPLLALLPARGAIRVRTLAARRTLRRGGAIGAHGTLGASSAGRLCGLGSRGALGTRGRGGSFAPLGPVAPRALAIDVHRPHLTLGLAHRVHLRVHRTEGVLLFILVVLSLGEVVRDRRLTPLEQTGEDPADRPPDDVAQRRGEEELQSTRREQRHRADEQQRRADGAQAAESRPRKHGIRDVADHEERQRRHEEAQQDVPRQVRDQRPSLYSDDWLNQ